MRRSAGSRKKLIFVDWMRLAQIESRRRISVRLSPDFFFATAVALLPFDSPYEMTDGETKQSFQNM